MSQTKDPKMSHQYKDEEQKIAEEKRAAEQLEIDKRTKIYFNQATKYQLGGYVREKKTGGNIDQPEQCLRFTDNLFVTPDLEIQEFIEHSRPFINGHIKPCKNMTEANLMRAANNAVKQVGQIKGDDMHDHARY